MPRVVPSQAVELIDRAFPWASMQKTDQRSRIMAEHDGVLSAIVSMADAIPADLITLTPQYHSNYMAALWTIRAQLDSWRAHGKTGSMERIKGVDTRNPVAVLRECLSQCPDEPAPVTAKDFVYVTDAHLRRNLLSDLAGVSRALSNGEWKAATVLGGSCLEALLLWAVTETKNKDSAGFATAVKEATARTLKQAPPADSEQWVLHQLLEVCLDLGLITASTATQARLAKDFRNLIHPGRALRLAASCNIGTACAARAALEFAALDLAKKFP